MKLWFVGAVGFALLVGGCSTGDNSSDAAVDDVAVQGGPQASLGTESVSPAEMVFVDCVDSTDPAVIEVVKETAKQAGAPKAQYWDGVQCAGLQVPLDYENPDSSKITINVSRIPATGSGGRIGSLLTNPGGPGGAGLALPLQLRAVVPPGKFDLIGFDPRGVGTSAPLYCQDDLTPMLTLAPTVTDPEVNQARETVGNTVDAACQKNSTQTYQHLGTANAARDMDLIRQALGDDSFNFIGFSYGTLLGTYYANLFPDKVRALVLDGALSPTLTSRDIQTGGTQAAERGMDAFLKNCKTVKNCAFNNGSDLGKRFTKLMDKLTADPLPVSFKQGGEVQVGAAVAYRAALEGLGQGEASWVELGEALTQADASNGTGLAQLYAQGVGYHPDGTWDTNLEPAYFTIARASAILSSSLSDFEDLEKFGKKMWRSVVALNVPGTYFNVPADRQTGPMPAKGAPPILVLSATRDPSTAYEWGVELARQLDSGVLVTRDGDGHTSMLSSPDCFNIAWQYLVDPTTAPPRSTGAKC
ncbi:alpha/beta fold hydrolase [Candidatus Nanopelagicales bacterium]|nr:alpha/beta fold hydrolase [Candidatus Nanopelagicales bacterium]